MRFSRSESYFSCELTGNCNVTINWWDMAFVTAGVSMIKIKIWVFLKSWFLNFVLGLSRVYQVFLFLLLKNKTFLPKSLSSTYYTYPEKKGCSQLICCLSKCKTRENWIIVYIIAHFDKFPEALYRLSTRIWKIPKLLVNVTKTQVSFAPIYFDILLGKFSGLICGHVMN